MAEVAIVIVDRDRVDRHQLARMFFILSKVLGFFALPSNFLMAIGLVGLVLLCTRFTRLASWLIVTSLVLIAVAGLSPLGNVADPAVGAALPALGCFARAARRH